MPDPLDVSKGLNLLEAGVEIGRAEGHRAGWREGYAAGWSEGREALAADFDEDQRAAATAANHATVAHCLRNPPYADLAEIRGEHWRAERQRALLAANGVTAR